MTTAIIGTGGIGSAIARQLAAGGETLQLSSADKESARKLAAAIGGAAVVALDNRSALQGTDAIVRARHHASATPLAPPPTMHTFCVTCASSFTRQRRVKRLSQRLSVFCAGPVPSKRLTHRARPGRRPLRDGRNSRPG